MQISDILKQPTSIGKNHESLYRSYHILEYVEHLLKENTPPSVILEIIAHLRTQPRAVNMTVAPGGFIEFHDVREGMVVTEEGSDHE